MMGFEIIEFERTRHITIRGDSRLFRSGVGSYLIVPENPDGVAFSLRIFWNILEAFAVFSHVSCCAGET